MRFFVDWDAEIVYQVPSNLVDSFRDFTLDCPYNLGDQNGRSGMERACGLVNNEGFRLVFWNGSEIVGR